MAILVNLAVLCLLRTIAFGEAQGMDMKCVTSHCGGKFARAMIDLSFLRQTACNMGCQRGFDADHSPGKIHYQNCTTKCVITYESPAGDDFLSCAMVNNCLKFPPIPGHCPYREEHVQPDASLASISGEWWQERGYNQLWDCYPCQHIHSNFLVNDSKWCAQTVNPEGPVKAPCWNYTYSYDVFLVDGSTKNYGQSWQLPSDTPKGKPIDIFYTYQGTTHNETWFPVKATEKYTLIAFCSYMMSWINVGSIVWVRSGHELTDAENQEIAHVYKSKFDIDYSTFCNVRHGNDKCDGPNSLASRNMYLPRSARPFVDPETLMRYFRLGQNESRTFVV
jgi:hypothetical protein